VALTFLLLGRHPEWVPIYYTLKALLLLTIRWYVFKYVHAVTFHSLSEIESMHSSARC
jgi:hypothetical protein